MKHIATLLFIVIGSYGRAQFISISFKDGTSKLNVRAQVQSESRASLKRVNVSLRDTLGNEVRTVDVNRKGRLMFEVPYEHVWELWATCEGHQTKIIRFSTLDVPTCEGKWGYYYNLKLNLQKGESEPKYVAHVFYESCTNNFISKKY